MMFSTRTIGALAHREGHKGLACPLNRCLKPRRVCQHQASIRCCFAEGKKRKKQNKIEKEEETKNTSVQDTMAPQDPWELFRDGPKSQSSIGPKTPPGRRHVHLVSCYGRQPWPFRRKAALPLAKTLDRPLRTLVVQPKGNQQKKKNGGCPMENATTACFAQPPPNKNPPQDYGKRLWVCE